MVREWTFGQKVGAGFALTVALTAVMGAVAIVALRGVVSSKDRVIEVHAQVLTDAQALETARQRKSAAIRGFLLGRDEQYVAAIRDARTGIAEALGALRRNTFSDEAQRLVNTIEEFERQHQLAMDQAVTVRRSDPSVDAALRVYDAADPIREQLDTNIRSLVQRQRQVLQDEEQAASGSATTATWIVVAISVGVLGAAVIGGVILTRSVTRQVGTAVGQVQSSAAELQAVATQQATGAKEQATAMSEISTTISELLATSRQITQSAQRVAQIAGDTAAAARAGDDTVAGTRESIEGIRRQVDMIVTHMLELGKKSQQIGGVLEIVSELAEQTNILAINATIEAAGAGESGKRFAVVAEEIRKLADRVAGSTKEIRGLIDDVRSSVNTTVMATETGSKAVDAGSRRFSQVAESFTQIASLVATTTDAAREIELSTKQQMTAVEQVNVAIGNVAQAARETESSSGQTQQTASQLALLSKGLLRLIQPQAGA